LEPGPVGVVGYLVGGGLLMLAGPVFGADMTLHEIIEFHAQSVNLPEGCEAVQPAALLKAIAQVESSGGNFQNASRSEPHLRGAVKRVHPKEYRRWGDTLIASHGAFQILGTTALELGMAMPPERLREPEISVTWAIVYINSKLRRKSHAFVSKLGKEGIVKAIADAYNSGSAADQNKPFCYMSNVWKWYQKFEVDV
jgi:hypothetical protein